MANLSRAHEDYSRREKIRQGSDRGFGLSFAGILTVLGGLLALSHKALVLWPFGIALLFLLLAFIKPVVLAPINRLWFRFGLLLNRIVNPVIMGLIFFFAVTPIGLVMRLSRKDSLRLKRDPEAGSYWIERDPPGPPPDSLKNQF